MGSLVPLISSWNRQIRGACSRLCSAAAASSCSGDGRGCCGSRSVAITDQMIPWAAYTPLSRRYVRSGGFKIAWCSSRFVRLQSAPGVLTTVSWLPGMSTTGACADSIMRKLLTSCRSLALTALGVSKMSPATTIRSGVSAARLALSESKTAAYSGRRASTMWMSAKCAILSRFPGDSPARPVGARRLRLASACAMSASFWGWSAGVGAVPGAAAAISGFAWARACSA